MGDEWTGWRGGTLEGRSVSTSAPLHWSANDHVAWRTPIPGEGHSSPIASHGAIFVTTARPMAVNRPMLSASRSALLVACLILSILIVRFAVSVCAFREVGRGRSCGLPGLAVTVVLALALCLLVLFGEAALSFGVAPERAWLAACLGGLASLVLASHHAKADSPAPPLAAAGLLALSGIAILAVPDWQHTLGPDAPRSVAAFMWAIIVLPALVGACIISLYAAGRATKSAAGSRSSGLSRWRAIAWVTGAIACGALCAIITVMAGIVAGSSTATEHTVTAAALYRPRLAIWLPAVPAILAIALVATARRRRGLWRNLSLVCALAALIVLSVAVAVEQLLSHVRYLTYLAGAPDMTPILGWRAAQALAVVSALALVGFAAHRATRPPAVTPMFPVLARWLAIAIGAGYFLYALYLPKAPYMDRGVVAVNAADGGIQWIGGSVRGPREPMNNENSAATPTPVTDGRRVYAYFGAQGLLCVDLDGRRQWLNRELPYDSREGVASSPILCHGRIIILSESEAGSYLAAVDCSTGRIAWRTERLQKVHSYAGNCRTPTVIRPNGRDQVVVWGFEDVSGYDPDTGRELWSHVIGDLGIGDNPVASAVSDGQRIYLAGINRTVALDIGRLGAPDSPIAWQSRTSDGGVQCASPVLQNGLLFAVSDSGSAYCLDVATGREVWRKDLRSQHYASPVSAGDRIYFCDTRGRTTVVGCSTWFRLIADNRLGERTFASFAPVGGRLYVRTRANLYCIAEAP